MCDWVSVLVSVVVVVALVAAASLINEAMPMHTHSHTLTDDYKLHIRPIDARQNTAASERERESVCVGLGEQLIVLQGVDNVCVFVCVWVCMGAK